MSVGFINHLILVFYRNAGTSHDEPVTATGSQHKNEQGHCINEYGETIYRTIYNDGQAYHRESIPKHPLEKAGDYMVWHVTKLPQRIGHWLKDPRVLTIALTALALIAVTFIFYPVSSFLATKAIVVFIAAHLPAIAIKAFVYALTMLAVVGIGTRALGRFINKDLMDHFYACHGCVLNDEKKLVPLTERIAIEARRPKVAVNPSKTQTTAKT